MAVTERSRAVIFLLCTLPAIYGQGYEIPEVSIVPLKPRGVRISIPEKPNMNLFAFQGHVNRYIGDDDVGDISGEVMRPTDGYFTYQDNNVVLKVGDVIYYYVHVIKDRKGYHKSKQTYTVRELFDPSQPTKPVPPGPVEPIVPIVPISPVTTPSATCRPSSTIIISADIPKTLCSGQIIFEDNFDTLNEDLWIIEQYIPSNPEYPYVSYQRPTNSPTVSVSNGVLSIDPKLQETLPGFDSDAIIYQTLDLLVGCTRPTSCTYKSEGAQILPPIASGRIRSKLAFKYGFIEIKAKVPQGDWLYPDILLESLANKYGTNNYASGVLRIAGVLGNMILSKGSQEYGNKVLYGGPMMNFKCRTNLLAKKISSTEWGNDFHVYSLRWAPEMITLYVDGEEWGRIDPPSSGLQSRLPANCDPPRQLLTNPIAPFDEYFNIILGVSAGGVSEFPDGVISQYTISKPWKNTSQKARLNFYQAKSTWHPTWTQPALTVDYVKVRAL